MGLRNRMSPAPGLDMVPPVAGIGGGPRSARLGPGRWILADELGPMAPWSSRRGWRGRVSGEAAPCTQADQEADGLIVQGQTQLDGVVAGVEGEDRRSGQR